MIQTHIKKRIKEIIRLFSYDIIRINTDDISLYIKLYGQESVENRLFCNISAGGHFDFGCGIHHPCWTNIDLDRPWKADKYNSKGIEYNPETDIAHDFLSNEPLPVNSGTIELVYSRNSIEHLPDQSVNFMFQEVFRILKPGGIFRIAAPDIDLLYRVYSNNDREFFNWYESNVSIEQAFLRFFSSHASTLHHDGDGVLEKISDNELREIFRTMEYEDALDFCASKCSIDVYKKDRMHLYSLSTHINWWNKKKLGKVLSQAGFEIINISAPEQSQSPVLRNSYYFDNFANYCAFYMEAVKV